MSGESPDPERTIIVEEAHLLHDQIDHCETEAEDADEEVNREYHERRAVETRELVNQLEGNGLPESEVREQYEDTAQELDDLEADTVEWARTLARHDAARQTINEYFGGTGHGPVELGDITASSVYQDGTIELLGMKGRKAHMTVSSESTALATADTFLSEADTSIDELKSAVGRSL